MNEYKVVFTDLGKAFAAKVGGVMAVEERVRGELAHDLMADDDLDINDLILHVVSMDNPDGGDDVEFIVKPSTLERDVLVVDTATYEDIGPITEGPFAGKTVMMPAADSDD